MTIFFIVIASILIILFIVTIVRYYLSTRQKTKHTIRREDINDSDRMIRFNELQGRKPLIRFLNEHPDYTKESMEKEFISIAEALVSLKEDSRIAPKITQIMAGETKRKKIVDMKVQRANFINYSDGMVFAIAVFADQKDEYVLSMRFNVKEHGFYLFAYDIMLGSKTNLER